MPQFSVMTFMFKKWWQSEQMSIQCMLEGFANVGIDGVEPFHRDFVEDPTLTKRYREMCDANGLKVAAVDVMCNLVCADAEQKQKERDELRRGLDICKQLGTGIAHVAGHRLRDDVSPSDGRKMIAEGLLEVAELAESYGLVLAIEDFDPAPTLICSAADCLEIMDLTGGRVKFVFDTGNFSAAGERADEVFPLLADRIVHVHIKDGIEDSSVPAGRRHSDIGAGTIPNAEVAKMLTQRGYDQWVSLETRRREDLDPVAAMKMELPIVKSWFGM